MATVLVEDNSVESINAALLKIQKNTVSQAVSDTKNMVQSITKVTNNIINQSVPDSVISVLEEKINTLNQTLTQINSMLENNEDLQQAYIEQVSQENQNTSYVVAKEVAEEMVVEGTPKYVGASHTLLDPTEYNEGDWFLLDMSVTEGEITYAIGLYKLQEGAWVGPEEYTEENKYMFNAASADLMKYYSAGGGVGGFALAFIEHLFANTITANELNLNGTFKLNGSEIKADNNQNMVFGYSNGNDIYGSNSVVFGSNNIPYAQGLNASVIFGRKNVENLSNDTNINKSIFLGYGNCKDIKTAYDDTIIGTANASFYEEGNSNVILGTNNALYRKKLQKNVILGCTAAFYNDTAGTDELLEGSVVIGYNAGTYIEGGQNNVCIGFNANLRPDGNVHNNNINLGNRLFVDDDGQLYVGTGWYNKTRAALITDIPDMSNYVPKTRTVNGKALSSNISLTASDIGLVYKSGDTYSLSNSRLPCTGYITNDSTDLFMTIPLPKLASGLTATITTLKCNTRGTFVNTQPSLMGSYVYKAGESNAYLDGGRNWLSVVNSVSCIGFNLVVKLSYSTKWRTGGGIINNYPISVELNNFAVKFS